MKTTSAVIGAVLLVIIIAMAVIVAVFENLAAAETVITCGLDPPGDAPDGDEPSTVVSDRLTLSAGQELNARLILGAGRERLASSEQLTAMMARAIARADLFSQVDTGGLLGLEPLAFPAVDVTDKTASIDAWLAADPAPFDLAVDGEWLPEAETIVARWGNSTANPTTCIGPGGDSVTEEDIVSVNGILIHAEFADNLDRLLTAAAADGVILSGWGWRSHQDQHRLRSEHCPNDGSWTHSDDEDPSTWLPASSCRPPTARPGFSNHESGFAVDFTYNGASIGSRTGPGWHWLAANANRYGFYNLPSEPWHWSIDGN